MNKDDEKWVKDNINKLPTIKLKVKAWEGYQKTYKDNYNEHDICDNKARLAANTALRLFIKRVFKQ